MKKSICSLLVILCLFGCALPICAADDIQVVLDGTQLAFDVPPQIVKGRTMVPIRAIFEALGAEVEWDAKTRTVTATIDDYTVQCTIDSKTMTVCGEKVQMDVAPVIVDGRTLMPARFAAEAFDCMVLWVGSIRTAFITTPGYTDPSTSHGEQ